jgi:uncharacterized membrane protein (DUF373 family)
MHTVKVKNHTINESYIEFGITIGIFLFLLFNGVFFKIISFFEVVSAMLSFIIILELVRMLGQYIFTEIIHLRYILDAFIVFCLRDLLLILNNENYNVADKYGYSLLLLIVIFSFFAFRYFSIKVPAAQNLCECECNK